MGEILDIGDIAERPLAEVFITRAGQRIPLPAYRDDERCPGSTRGLISAARKDYREATMLGTDDYQPDDIAWFRMLRNLLDAAIPSLLPQEADVLAGNDAKALDILRGLGWWPKADEEIEPGESKGAETLTTAPSSPD